MPQAIDFPEVPGWIFTVQEVSNGVHRIDGRDSAGHLVSRVGSNFNTTVGKCIEDAKFVSHGKNGYFGALDWALVADEFRCDGSLRDIYVLGTTQADWDMCWLGSLDTSPLRLSVWMARRNRYRFM